MKSFKKSYTINASLEDVWQALVDAKVIDDWGGGPAEMSDIVGDEFSLWNGDIWGKNTKVEKHKVLEQEWTSGKWDEPSKVSFKLHENDGKTMVDLDHQNIPDKEFEEIKNGWDQFYMGPLSKLLDK